MTKSRAAAMCTATVIAVALSGCTADGRAPAHHTEPTFSGSWAPLLKQEYRSTKSKIVREILSKGHVSDRDFAEVSERYLQCMRSKGFPTTIDSPFGAETIQHGNHSPEETLAVQKSCSTEMTPISYVRTQMLRNPRALPENDIIAACLVRSKLVAPSYSGRDYGRDLNSSHLPFDMDSEAATKCHLDPLNIVGTTKDR